MQSLAGGDVDVGGRTNRKLYQFGITSHYAYSEKTSFEANLSRSYADYQAQLDSVEWVNQNWVDYQLLAKTRVGAGLTFGFLSPEGGQPQSYEQALLRVSLPATGKLTVAAEGGMEARHVRETQTTQPVFRVSVAYRPFDGTDLSVAVSRRSFNSAAQAGVNYTTTGISASVRQRFFGRIFLTLAGGFEDAKYQAVEPTASSTRHDRFLFVRPSLSLAVTKRSQIELFYERRSNDSNTGFSFENNVTGLQASFNF